jgi:predicted CXXCH cytochrome family protein
MPELLQPGLYYPDGQIRDEVYELGSFLQSKMHAQGIRCTDCHDPHTARLRHTGNQLCTSCHAHSPARYDTPAHHHHPPGSHGAQCVACHMPDRPYMELDFRRDHSLRIPRPDLSVDLKTPNACTQCHLEQGELPADRRTSLPHYAAWLEARERGDLEVEAALSRIDRWAAEIARDWYGEPDYEPVHYAHAFDAAWRGEPQAGERLQQVLRDRRYPAIVRASALAQLAQRAPESAAPWVVQLLDDPEVLLRGTAAAAATNVLPTRELYLHVVPLLSDPVRWVRIEAARATAGSRGLNVEQQTARQLAWADLQAMWDHHADLIGTYIDQGLVWERAGEPLRAMDSYRQAISLDPLVAGPRSNWAALLEQQGKLPEAQQLRDEEFPLLERDARRAPDLVDVQYRYALALYLQRRPEDAVKVLQRCTELAPGEAQVWLTLKLLYEHLNQPAEAAEADRRLKQLQTR